MLADDHVLTERRKLVPHHMLISDGYLYRPDGRRDSLRQGWGSFRGLEPYLAVVRLALQSDKTGRSYLTPSSMGAALKPDLADFETREVWEVKPDSRYGDAAGGPQLELYLSLLNTAEREYLALSRHPRYRSAEAFAPAGEERPWRPGGRWKIPKLETSVGGRRVRVGFDLTSPGVIQWQLD
jgi:hypothetical protein